VADAAALPETTRPSPWRARLFLLLSAVLTAAVDLGSKAWAFHALDARIVTGYLVVPTDQPDAVPKVASWLPGPESGMRVIAERPVIARGAEQVSVIAGCFDFRASMNTGAVFGLGSGRTGLVMLFTIVALGAIGWFILKADPCRVWLHVGFGLVVGGAIGNLWDRLRYAGVRDFIHWFYASADGLEHAWPTFNVADAALCAGIAVIIILELRQPGDAKAAPAPSPAA
jgi:signal peptidase II